MPQKMNAVSSMKHTMGWRKAGRVGDIGEKVSRIDIFEGWVVISMYFVAVGNTWCTSTSRYVPYLPDGGIRSSARSRASICLFYGRDFFQSHGSDVQDRLPFHAFGCCTLLFNIMSFQWWKNFSKGGGENATTRVRIIISVGLRRIYFQRRLIGKRRHPCIIRTVCYIIELVHKCRVRTHSTKK